MRKSVLFSIILVLVFLINGCSEDDGDYGPQGDYIHISGQPAIVISTSNIPFVQIPYNEMMQGYVLVPELSGQPVESGDCLWVDFSIDDSQTTTSSGYKYATNFVYEKIDSTHVLLPDETAFEAYLTDDYTDSIADISIHREYIESMLFFTFTHKAPADAQFKYEFFLMPQPDYIATHRTIYIRTKRIKEGSGEITNKQVRQGVDMMPFVLRYSYDEREVSGKSQSSISFNIVYNSGTKNGKDIYNPMSVNPITWVINRPVVYK